jgi:ferredoxin-type protein NapH
MKRISTANLRAVIIAILAAVILFGYIAKLDVGNLSALGTGIIATICPLGAIETTLASLTVIPRALIAVLIAVVFVVILGRVFCAWVCPVPLIQRWFPGHKRKEKELADEIDVMSAVAKANTTASADEDVDASAEATVTVSTGAAVAEEAKNTASLCGRLRNVKLDSRHVVLGGSLLSAAVFGFPVFCLICPVGLTFASLLVIYRLFGFGEVTWAIVVFPLILVFELVVFRKWCSKICPLGALMSLVAGANRLFRPHIDDRKCLATRGIRCSLCAKACDRENIDLRHPASSQGALSDCTKCGDCADACPTKAISFPLLSRGRAKENEPTADKDRAAS